MLNGGYFQLQIKNNGEGFELMVKALLSLEDAKECEDFLTDLCTIPEMQAMSQRIQVAKMLHQRKVYNEICKDTGASTATISRVNRCLNYGTGAYKNIFARLQENGDI